jgi:hypothetical protein
MEEIHGNICTTVLYKYNILITILLARSKLSPIVHNDLCQP